MNEKWIGLNVDKLIPSPPIDLRLGYCTRHGHTTVCPYCEIESLQAQLRISTQTIGHQGSLLEALQAKLARYEAS